MTQEAPIPFPSNTAPTKSLKDRSEEFPVSDPVRTAVRFPIHATVRLKTALGEIEAHSENISANGLLFTCDPLPALDTRIEFTILMPSDVMGTEADVNVECVGRVVRHVNQGTEKKAAVIIDEYLLKA